MTRRRVVCVCSRESEPVTDDQRRAFGWRLVPAMAELPCPAIGAAAADVFVWVCPPCASLRNAQLRANQAAS